MKLGMFAKLLAITPVALLAAIGTSATAEARSHAAILGNPGTGSESSCFNFITSFGSVRQVCAGTKTWVIAPVYDNAGGMNVRVSVFSSVAGDVQCRARSVDHLGLAMVTGTLASSAGRGLGDITSSLPLATGFGGVQVNCDMAQNTELINVHY